jgi:hypothetical protein
MLDPTDDSRREAQPAGELDPETGTEDGDAGTSQDLEGEGTPSTAGREGVGPRSSLPTFEAMVGGAQVVVALAVVAALVLLALSWSTTSERLASISESVDQLSDRLARVDTPEFQVTGISWIRGNAPISCGEYPTGVRVELTNVSLVPARQYPIEGAFFYGDSLLVRARATPVEGRSDEPVVVSPGQTVIHEQFVPGMSPVVDARGGVLSGPPYFTVALRVPVSGLVDSELREWSAAYLLRSFDCANPGLIAWEPRPAEPG